ncbi:Receptor-like kinase TMK3 [Bienertia sinuspersici]
MCCSVKKRIIMQKERVFLWLKLIITLLGFSLISSVCCVTDPNDLRVLNEFREGLKNPELLQWPKDDNDPCGSKWNHVFCSGNRVTQIQVQNLGLIGTLPSDFNKLSKLSNLGLQRNKFHGKLPTFNGLSNLEFAYLDFNNFDEIPSDFFVGLTSVRVLELDNNPLNATKGWSLPNDVGKLAQLVNFSMTSCNLVGPLPEFLGSLPSLSNLRLSYNKLSGVIPLSFNQSMLQTLWLNDQEDEGMSGTIDVIASMPYLTQVWLHGNHFSGAIPESIGNLASLKELNLNRNQLVGVIPQSLASMELDKLDLNNNMLMGSIPKFKAGNVSYDFNSFCQKTPGLKCAPEVDVLLDFLGGMNYPNDLASEWSGNNPCEGPWLGVSCNADSKIVVLNLPNRNLNGTLSPSIGRLDSLRQIRLSGNNLNGQIPANVTQLKSLTLLDVTRNNFEPPLPKLHTGLKVLVDGNPLFAANKTSKSSPPPVADPPSLGSPPLTEPPLPSPSPPASSRGGVRPPLPERRHPTNVAANHSSISAASTVAPKPPKPKRLSFIIAIAAIAAVIVLILLSVLFYVFCCKKNKGSSVEASSSVVFHPKDPNNPDNVVKVAVSSNNTGSLFTQTGSSSESVHSSAIANSDSHVLESGNLVISVQVLRKVTNNFSPENQLGRGGFGVVYKGELGNGTKIAVKRMESGVINTKQLDEFQAEIAVLSKVRHRHLVSLFGYSTEGNEKLLVYEYMPQGALSKHLFRWRDFDLEPLSWKRRLAIALDVARGMEYLHTLAQQSFIHRDLKSSNILLDEEFRAKVSDFGLVKLAPDREKSVATRLAGTFGYLAPEYAVTGKVSTKVDVFSFGVVLMELLTGLMALDEERSEESRYLAEWFWRIKSNQDTLMAAIDPTLDVNEEAFDSINIIAELAGHCTARDPNHRPDMGHAVSVLAPLIDIWKPFNDDVEDYSGIDFTLPLKEMLKGWQNESISKENSCTSMDDSRGSIPARPTGFADSFTSADAR